MSRIIKTETVGRDRNQLVRGIVITIRELLSQKKPDSHSKDYVAFIIICLWELDATIERTVLPWEKRDYWVKADKFRMEWFWLKDTSAKLSESLDFENWEEIIEIIMRIAKKLSKTSVSPNHKMGKPWKNSFLLYQSKLKKKK